MNPRRNGLFAIFVSALLLLSAVVLVVNGNASTANPPSVPTVPSAPIAGPSLPSFSSLSNPSTTESALVQAFAAEHTPAAEQALFDGLSPSLVAAFWHDLTAHNANALKALLTPADGTCGTGGDLCIVGISEIALAVCAIGAGETLGLACLAGGLAVLGVYVWELLTGQSASEQIGKQVEALAQNLADEFVTELQLAALGMENQLSALNATVNALGYEGAAAALSQLGNASFNEPLNLAQSGIAGEMAGVLAAQMATVANLEGQAIAITSSELGSANSEGQYCTLSIGGIQTPTPAASSCPTTSVSFTYPTGTASFGMALNWAQNNVDEFLNASETMTIWGGGVAGTVEFIPLDGSHPYINMTAPANPAIVNFTGPTGAYQIVLNLASENNILWPSIAAPLSAGALTSGGAENTVIISGASASEITNGAITVLYDSCGAESVSYLCGTTYGDTAAAMGTYNAPSYLFNLELAAETQAETYWQVLRNLGYTNADQVPARCLIPSPAQLLPMTLTPTQLAAMNETTMLRIYYALLGNLAFTFNASSTITAYNVCGHHVVVPTGSSPIGFGTYAYGYIYVAGAGGWAVPSPPLNNTAGPEVYSSAITWNLSGIVSFAPAISAFAVPLQTDWLLPDDNPSFATVQPFTSNVTNPRTGTGYVTTDGPTGCLVGGGDLPANCSLASSPLTVLDYIGGNSSANHGYTGSAFPTHEDGSGASYSVLLTACFTAQNDANIINVTYTETTTGTCSFNHNTVNSTAYVVCGDGLYAFNLSACPHTTPILVITTNGCGGAYLSWLAGPIASAIGFVVMTRMGVVWGHALRLNA